MTPQEFAYWLRGYFEITSCSSQNSDVLLSSQVDMIREHLDKVFTPQDPEETTRMLNDVYATTASGDPAPWDGPTPTISC